MGQRHGAFDRYDMLQAKSFVEALKELHHDFFL
jgi:hypothetical protein